MTKLLKLTPYYAIVFLFLLSCNTSTGIYLSGEEGAEKIKDIISENLDEELEVYLLDFSAEKLTGRIADIAYRYQLKGNIFQERYAIKENTFSDPTKSSSIFSKTFKIKDAPISIIPVKYEEAIGILDELGLYEEGEAYYLDSWTFRTDIKGKITANFYLNYYMNTTQSGKVRTTNYGQYSFSMNSDESLKLNK